MNWKEVDGSHGMFEEKRCSCRVMLRNLRGDNLEVLSIYWRIILK